MCSKCSQILIGIRFELINHLHFSLFLQHTDWVDENKNVRTEKHATSPSIRPLQRLSLSLSAVSRRPVDSTDCKRNKCFQDVTGWPWVSSWGRWNRRNWSFADRLLLCVRTVGSKTHTRTAKGAEKTQEERWVTVRDAHTHTPTPTQISLKTFYQTDVKISERMRLRAKTDF